MKLRIISTTDTVFDGEVFSVTLPGANGSFMVLNNHASIVSTLVAGKLSYRLVENEDSVEMQVSGGIVDVDNNVVSVCIY